MFEGLRDNAGATAIAVVTDLTGAATNEERLRQAQRLSIIGRMTTAIAHDFNNLLTVMFGYNELVLSSLAEQDPRREYLLEVRGGGVRASALTRSLLAFGRRRTPSVAVDVNMVIHDIEGMLRLLAGKHIQMTTSLCPTMTRVSAAPTQIEQIVVNLCVNACDAMPDGGSLSIETRQVLLDDEEAKVRHTAPGRYALLVVSDTGVGMNSALLARIWEPFFTTKKAGKGTGLGLATLLAIVKEAGGCVNVESVVGQGTTFRIYLPAAGRPAADGDKPGFEEVAPLSVRRQSTPQPERVRVLNGRHKAAAGRETHGYQAGG